MLNSFSRRNVAHLVFKRWRLGLTVFCAPLVLYLLLIAPKVPQYESFASLMVKVVDQEVVAPDIVSEQQGRSAGSSANMAKQIINSEQVIITSLVVLRAAIERVGVGKVYPELAYTGTRATVLDRAAEQLAKDMTVKVNTDTNILLLSVLHPTPRVAQQLLQALVAATVDKQAQVMRDPRTEFLKQKLEALRAESDSAQADLLRFKQETQITSFDEERGLLLKQRDKVELELSQLRAELVSAAGRSGALNRVLSTTPRDVELSDENDRAQHQLDQAQARFAQAKARLEVARRRFTEQNPELDDAYAQVEDARRALEEVRREPMGRVRSGANPVSQELSASLASARSDLDAHKGAVQERERQLVQLNERLAYLDKHEMELRELEHRRDIADADYRSYMERAQSARIVTDMNEAGITNLSIVQPPTLPFRPSRPRKLLLFVLALFAGVVAAMAVLVGAELMDDTLSLPEQVEEATGLPLLATVRAKKYG